MRRRRARPGDTCAAHCAKLVADGQKHHLATLKTCTDCASTPAGSCVNASQALGASDIVCNYGARRRARGWWRGVAEKHGGDDPTMKSAAECRGGREGVSGHAQANRSGRGQVTARLIPEVLSGGQRNNQRPEQVAGHCRECWQELTRQGRLAGPAKKLQHRHRVVTTSATPLRSTVASRTPACLGAASRT